MFKSANQTDPLIFSQQGRSRVRIFISNGSTSGFRHVFSFFAQIRWMSKAFIYVHCITFLGPRYLGIRDASIKKLCTFTAWFSFLPILLFFHPIATWAILDRGRQMDRYCMLTNLEPRLRPWLGGHWTLIWCDIKSGSNVGTGHQKCSKQTSKIRWSGFKALILKPRNKCPLRIGERIVPCSSITHQT